MFKHFFLLILTFLVVLPVFGQHTFEAIVKDKESNEPLAGVNAQVQQTLKGGSSNAEGIISIEDVPAGKLVVVFSYIGYKNKKQVFTLPLPSDSLPVVYLVPDEEELEEIIVSATRSSRSIEDIPTRVEAITAEELGEKAVMNSSNIAMLLRESTGIQVQQTSANSANSSIRIQGLDGRYTQILRDGFPIYGGFASGLSIMQIPPLDLQQVEVIKGSTSTLYGGGAIAGLVNLVSKQPEDEREISLMVNQTTALGTTVNGYYGQKFKKIGFTFYASANHQSPYDPNKDNFSDIPQIRSISLNPKVYFYFNESTNLYLGLNTAFENRLGGDIRAINDSQNGQYTFTELNLSDRFSTQLKFDKDWKELGRFTFRNSVNYFDRQIEIPDYTFAGKQMASFSEATYELEDEKTDWIVGANLYTDSFNEIKVPAAQERDYSNTTFGAFAQNSWAIRPKFIVESGLRTDYTTDYGAFILPRISALYKASDKLTTRLGGGLGYKLPTIFTEEAERLSYQGILPIQRDKIEAEKSLGGNFDINYKTSLFGDVFFSINQLFFYTRLTNSLVLREISGNHFFENAAGPVDSKGIETNIKLTYSDFKLFFNYALIDARLRYDNINRQKPLTPKHNAGMTLMYETEQWRIGYELYYIGKQYISNYTPKPDYWMMGFMVMRNFKNLGLFINFENFTDTRQSRFQPMIVPPFTNPTFTEIWAPTEGFVANGGFKISF